MMAAEEPRKRSCGILLYRRRGENIEVWLGHMGGPFWSKKDAAAWSIPKGEPLPTEDELTAALREYAEEIGAPAPVEDYEKLGEYPQPSGKIVSVFLSATEAEPVFIGSNTFDMEWPPHSGRIQSFPEIDGAAWVSFDDALDKVVKGQRPMLQALRERLGQE